MFRTLHVLLSVLFSMMLLSCNQGVSLTGNSPSNIKQAGLSDPQSNWRQCLKCQVLFFNGNPSQGSCSGGGSHVASPGKNYQLHYNVATYDLYFQSNWSWCDKCQGLWYTLKGTSTCPAGGKHNGFSSIPSNGSGNYGVPLVSPITLPGGPYYIQESNWVLCDRCDNLWLNNGYPGRCPGIPGHANAMGSSYLTPVASPGNEPTATFGTYQLGWRACDKCRGLYYIENGTAGRCAMGGGHNACKINSLEWKFLVHYNCWDPRLLVEFNWCKNCQLLFYRNESSVCPAGGSHSAGSLTFYGLPVANAGVGGAGTIPLGFFKYCNECKAVWWDDQKQTAACAGACPKTRIHGHLNATIPSSFPVYYY